MSETHIELLVVTQYVTLTRERLSDRVSEIDPALFRYRNVYFDYWTIGKNEKYLQTAEYPKDPSWNSCCELLPMSYGRRS